MSEEDVEVVSLRRAEGGARTPGEPPRELEKGHTDVLIHRREAIKKLHQQRIPMRRDRTTITAWSQVPTPSRPTPGSPASAKGHWVGPGA
ncbi:Hypothetical predicted protein [Lynx pardinus]|uniref:Uncharacterized protein n=1 Tax=Lynx pardinus TaxID=191816 RepID=A0A485MA99_LYNPA|nr:Hypothetical predicted protein [Lynx pardinus]